MAQTQPKLITQDGEPVVHFDADAVEEEALESVFTFRHGGEMFQMLPPEQADWKIAADLSEGEGMKAFMAELLGDDYERFAEKPMSSKKLGMTIDACSAFYGVKPGESKASKRSSRSTRRR
ncbi:hypothetical protein [Sphaerisporangium sp. TRM90804]|uniref:hypothetical protein n=1 Tax=Sphaerisporangium sp. TRM90804 TaxID=3031113 RepID=UPI0024487A5C|nr:hypothetical protein [Sphaerisporangium sp. TRM90804]MDH2424734.1 hypothetical protein [Sphaerisporangium sp. TRM90804]